MIIVYEEWYNGALATEWGRSNSIKGRWVAVTPEYMSYAIGMLLNLLGPARGFLELDGVLYTPSRFKSAPRKSPEGMLEYAEKFLRSLTPEPKLEDYEPIQFGL